MKEPEIINYIPEDEMPKFRLFFARPAKFGAFFLTRCLYSIEAEGKPWQQNMFIATVGILTAPTAIIDTVCLLVAYLARLVWYIIKSLWSLVIYAVKVILRYFFGTALKWVTLVLIALILWLKWDEITNIIRLWHW